MLCIGPLSFRATVSHHWSTNNSTHLLGVRFPATEIQLWIDWQLQHGLSCTNALYFQCFLSC